MNLSKRGWELIRNILLRSRPLLLKVSNNFSSKTVLVIRNVFYITVPATLIFFHRQIIEFVGFNSPTFPENFWPNFWADLLVGIVITSLVAWFYSRSHRLNINLACKLIHDLDGKQKRIIIAVENTGERNLNSNDAYYTILVINKLQPNVNHGSPTNPKIDQEIIGNEVYIRFDDLIRFPTFPHTRTRILELIINDYEIHDKDILYFFTTIEGRFPRSNFIQKYIFGVNKQNHNVIPGRANWYI